MATLDAIHHVTRPTRLVYCSISPIIIITGSGRCKANDNNSEGQYLSILILPLKVLLRLERVPLKPTLVMHNVQ